MKSKRLPAAFDVPEAGFRCVRLGRRVSDSEFKRRGRLPNRLDERRRSHDFAFCSYDHLFDRVDHGVEVQVRLSRKPK